MFSFVVFDKFWRRCCTPSQNISERVWQIFKLLKTPQKHAYDFMSTYLASRRTFSFFLFLLCLSFRCTAFYFCCFSSLRKIPLPEIGIHDPSASSCRKSRLKFLPKARRTLGCLEKRARITLAHIAFVI